MVNEWEVRRQLFDTGELLSLLWGVVSAALDGPAGQRRARSMLGGSVHGVGVDVLRCVELCRRNGLGPECHPPAWR